MATSHSLQSGVATKTLNAKVNMVITSKIKMCEHLDKIHTITSQHVVFSHFVIVTNLKGHFEYMVAKMLPCP